MSTQRNEQTGTRFGGSGFRHLRTRLLVVILLLVLLLQSAVFFAVSLAANRSARQATDEALALTAATFERTLQLRRESLLEKAQLLSSDYAFRDVFVSGDHATLISALNNYQRRARADRMLMADLDGHLLADTLHPAFTGVDFPYPVLLQAAENNDNGQTTAIVFDGEQAYQMAIVPLFAPAPVAWIGVGFAITDQWAVELKQQTHTQVSLLHHEARQWSILSSTLNSKQRTALLQHLTTGMKTEQASQIVRLGNEEFVSSTLMMHQSAQNGVYAVLQRSLDEALKDSVRLRWQLLLIFALTTVLAFIGARSISARITRPVTQLARGAKRIIDGEYVALELPAGRDELTQLTAAYNDMVHGLQEKDRVRALLGKVVSPAVAEELLSRKLELGGEEREVTLLFSDIRGFTSLSENRAPAQILQLLNRYLTQMSALVDAGEGVVDKYIGDAVMALFGAPLARGNDAQAAVRCALAMQAAMPELNRQFALEAWPELQIGIGIHTGLCVAGNMGSETRLNYTVIGDAVNLASRLEGLCKLYGVGIIVSAATRQACTSLSFREIDTVRVKGKQEPVQIFEALPAQFDAESLAAYEQGLSLYRQREWPAARSCFETALLHQPADALCLLYAQRCQDFIIAPPPADWDGVLNLEQK